MNCHSIVSPIQFDNSPKPLLVRKETYVEREEYDIHYDHNFDSITVIKTEVLVRHQSSSSTSEYELSALPHWNTIKEVYFREEEDPDFIQESTDEGVYEEVTQNSTYLSGGDNVEEEYETKKSMRSLKSMEVSSLVSMMSLTIMDYLSWTNFFKIVVILFCINGLLLQIILLTIHYFSYETAVDLQMVSEEDSDQNSVTICLPILFEEVLKSGDDNNTIFVKQRVNQLSDVFRVSPKISCSLRTSLSVCGNPVQSIDNSFKCFTFVFESGIELSVNSSQSLDLQNSYRVSIHSPKSLSNSFENDFQTLYFDKTYELRFWSIRMKRLSLPYTRCHTYHKSWTRSQCLHKCFVNSIKTFCPNCVPKDVFILNSDFDQSMKFCPKFECIQDFKYFHNDCQNSCSQDCSHQIYFSSVFSTQESGSKISLIIGKANSFATNGDFEFQQKPVLTLELYFASLGGLSVTWLMVFLILFTVIYFLGKLFEIFFIV